MKDVKKDVIDVGLVNLSNLYTYLHRVLSEDSVILGLLGLPENPAAEDTAIRIQKRKKPVQLVNENLPMISFYTNSGARSDNHLEYLTAFNFDVYTSDDIETAIKIAERISDLFHDKYVGIKEGSQFRGEFLTTGEAETDLANTYKFFTQILFTIGIEG